MAGTYLLAMIYYFSINLKQLLILHDRYYLFAFKKDAQNLVSHEKNKSIILDKTVLFTSFAPDFFRRSAKITRPHCSI